MPEKFAVQAVFTAVDHFSGPVARMSDTLSKFNGKGGIGGKGPRMDTRFREAGAAMGRIGEQARNVGAKIATVGVAGGFAAHKLITAGASVESALLAGSSKFGDGIRRNTPAFKELEQSAFSLGRATKFGAVEAAGALNELAASGFSPAAAMKNLPIMAQMAIAGGEDLQMASNIALDSMGVFGLLQDEMGNLRGPEQLAANLTRVADVMAYTANQTTASMGSIYETLTESGKLTDVAGMTFEKFAAITGALSQAGIKGSIAGTAIKNITVRLLSPTTEGKNELRKLKIDEKSFRKMTDPLEQLEVISKAIDKLPKEEKVKALDEYFGKIPLAAASFLASGGFRNARVLEGKILTNSTGSNAKQAEIIADSTDTKMALLKNKFQELGQVVFKEIQTPLESAITNSIKYLNENQGKFAQQAKGAVEWVGENGDNIGTAVEWGAYAWAGAGAAGLLNSGVTLATNIGKIAGGIGAASKAVGAAAVGANTALKTISMGRLGFTLAGGAAAGAAAAGVGSAVLANSWLKDDTEGLGFFDIAGKWASNAMYGGGPTNWGDIVDEHRNDLARQRYAVQVEQDEHAGRILTGSPMDSAMMTDQMARVQEFLGKPEALKPIEFTNEMLTQHMMPFAVTPVLDAVSMAIASATPEVVVSIHATQRELIDAINANTNVHTNTTTDIHVKTDPGTQARVGQTSAHTKVNNHRTGTN